MQNNINKLLNKNRRIIPKAWGYEEEIVNDKKYNFGGKILILKKGYQSSLHKHNKKAEVFYLDKGKVLMEIYGSKKIMVERDSLLIRPGYLHRFTGITNAKIIEFSSNYNNLDTHRETVSRKLGPVEFKKLLKG